MYQSEINMKPITTKTKIRKIIKNKLPTLTYHGIGSYTPDGASLSVSARNKRIKESRALLLANEEKFEATCVWINSLGKATEINRRHSSYFIKHIAERRIGLGHIANGTLIAAALYCGFKFEHSHQAPNLFFNIDEHSLQDAYEESLKFEKYPKCA